MATCSHIPVGASSFSPKNRPPPLNIPSPCISLLTTSLHLVSYTANIIGWRDKTGLTPEEREDLNKEIKDSQPSETEGIYLKVKGKDCVNLIAVRDVKPIKKPF